MTVQRPILTICFASLFFAVTLLIGILSNDSVRVSLFNEPITVLSGIRFDLVSRVDPADLPAEGAVKLDENAVMGKIGQWSFCSYDAPETPQYNVELESVVIDEDILPGEVFMVDMTFKNTGNTRLFSIDTECQDAPFLNVGTQKAQDRISLFGGGYYSISGWVSAGRVKMTDSYADPEQSFHVIFQSLAPEGDDIYREFFQPVVEGKAWIGSIFPVDISVGSPTDEMKDNIQYVQDSAMAVSALTGLERNVEVELSSQNMYVRFGETRVWTLRVSTGASDTPTPRGNYQVLSKQELRIGGKAPHYRMPYFQMWDSRGYGIHALPYLATDGGTFWTEALTHIGTPVSHGCIRTLPEDAIKLYNFTDIGTPVWVH